MIIDAIDRLVQGDTLAQARRFQYDGAGNITSRTQGGTTLTYQYDGNNRLTSLNGWSRPYNFAYDAQGNVTANGEDVFRYNAASQMECARCGQGNQITYVYDGLGMRVASTFNKSMGSDSIDLWFLNV